MRCERDEGNNRSPIGTSHISANRALQCARCGGTDSIQAKRESAQPENLLLLYLSEGRSRKEVRCPTIRCDDLDKAVLDALRSQPLNEIEIQRIWNR